MKAKPIFRDKDGAWVPCEPAEATHVWLNMPGPIPNRCIPVVQGNATRNGTGCWSWNGDTEKPTLKPSIITRGKRELTDEEHQRIMNGEKVEIPEVSCHSWVNDGKAVFLNDSTHELAGKTVDLLEVDW